MTWEDLRDSAIVAYERSRGVPPSWTQKAMFQLHLLLETPRGKTLTEPVFLAQFERFLASRDSFRPIQSGSISYFCEHFDEFGPEKLASESPEALKTNTCQACSGTGRVALDRVKGRAATTVPCQQCTGGKT